MYRESTNLT